MCTCTESYDRVICAIQCYFVVHSCCSVVVYIILCILKILDWKDLWKKGKLDIERFVHIFCKFRSFGSFKIRFPYFLPLAPQFLTLQPTSHLLTSFFTSQFSFPQLTNFSSPLKHCPIFWRNLSLWRRTMLAKWELWFVWEFGNSSHVLTLKGLEWWDVDWRVNNWC